MVSHLTGSAEEFQGVIWDRLEREIASLSSNSQYEMIKGATHASIVDNQDTWNVIIQLVEDIRRKN